MKDKIKELFDKARTLAIQLHEQAKEEIVERPGLFAVMLYIFTAIELSRFIFR